MLRPSAQLRRAKVASRLLAPGIGTLVLIDLPFALLFQQDVPVTAPATVPGDSSLPAMIKWTVHQSLWQGDRPAPLGLAAGLLHATGISNTASTALAPLWGSAGLLTLAMLTIVFSLRLALLPAAGLALASAVDGIQ